VLPEANPAPAGRTRNARIDQFDPRTLQGRNQLHERIDVAADDAVARFHALDGGDRKIRKVGGLPLIYVQERTGRPELVGRNHEMAVSGEIGQQYAYTVLITASSINLDAKYITRGSYHKNESSHPNLLPGYRARMRKHYAPFPKRLADSTIHDKRWLVHVF
jgi:hypothetical protein